MSDTSLAQDYRTRDWALVTGASDGIGRALATEAAKAGYNVILSGRRADRLELHAEALRRAYYVATIVLPADLSDPDQADALWAAAVAGRRIAVLVNNAGLGQLRDFAETEGWARETETIMVNVVAATILMKRAVAHMGMNGGGHVLNVASLAGFMPGPHMAVYHATKAYLLSLSEAVAVEAAKDAVFVTALCPGVTQTGFFAADGSERAHILNRWLPPQSAESVAAKGWQAMEKRRRICVTGAMNTVFSLLPRLAPRRVVTALTGQFLKRRW
ncbi:SDR family NAD(P)-dependent oxidoreductase [Pseudotabrizicola sp. L79]|uniref:SDR family NAD(P)-dependent oxidoreductase n=1 Tax=Pseudotabrizicola sp. L79 TaxID=3118402 RepID=UPI002F94B9A5